MTTRHQLRGFTLVEMIVVIVITGIIGGIVAIFLRTPVQGYVDSARRAELTDIADTAMRRISRDLHMALPNSVRITGTCSGSTTCYLEFIPTTGGGRYRDSISSSGAPQCGSLAADVLDFSAADTCFQVLGAMPPENVGSDQIVVYNLGITGANAYSGNTLKTDNRRVVSSYGASSISIVHLLTRCLLIPANTDSFRKCGRRMPLPGGADGGHLRTRPGSGDFDALAGLCDSTYPSASIAGRRDCFAAGNERQCVLIQLCSWGIAAIRVDDYAPHH